MTALPRRSVLAALACLPFAAPPLRGQGAAVSVVATTGMIADAATRIGGDRVAVRALMGPGIDPHGYRQTRTDIALLANADLILWHGLGLEAQLSELMADLGRSRRVVAVGETVPQAMLLADPVYQGRVDPHLWMDPAIWTHVVDAVAAALAAADPAGTEEFAAAALAYRADLASLRDYATRVLGSVRPQARLLVTAHDAFGYLAAGWGWEVAGIQGLSTESEAGLARIGDLVDLIVARQVPAVFTESSVSDRAVRALIEGAAARGHGVRIGGELYSDAMGPQGSYEGTYIGMIDHNVTTIARALGGQVPTGGMSGRLAAA